jgi:predicted secreted protein
MDVEATRGRPLDLNVEQFGTSGYVWRVESASPGIRQIDSADSLPQAGAAPGTAQSRTFRFVAEQEGDFEVVLAAKRAWEAEPAERRVFRIHVKPGD